MANRLRKDWLLTGVSLDRPLLYCLLEAVWDMLGILLLVLPMGGEMTVCLDFGQVQSWLLASLTWFNTYIAWRLAVSRYCIACTSLNDYPGMGGWQYGHHFKFWVLLLAIRQGLG